MILGMEQNGESAPVVPVDETFAESAHQLLSHAAHSIKDSQSLIISLLSTPSGVGLTTPHDKASYLLYLKVPTAWMKLEEAVDLLNYYLIEEGSSLVLREYSDVRKSLTNKNIRKKIQQGVLDLVLGIEAMGFRLEDSVVDHKVYITVLK